MTELHWCKRPHLVSCHPNGHYVLLSQRKSLAETSLLSYFPSFLVTFLSGVLERHWPQWAKEKHPGPCLITSISDYHWLHTREVRGSGRVL